MVEFLEMLKSQTFTSSPLNGPWGLTTPYEQLDIPEDDTASNNVAAKNIEQKDATDGR